MRVRVIFICISALSAAGLGMALGACGEDEAGSGTRVVATTGIVAEMAERVAGADAEVVQLIPDAASPHDFQLSARDRLDLEEADLVVHVGAGLDAGVPLDATDAQPWALTEHVGELLRSGGHGAAGEDDEATDPHDEAGDPHDQAGDPHVWMDPRRTARALPALARALAAVDPGAARRYRERAARYAADLRALDRRIERRLAAIGSADRELVTSHDALGYFADRYSFEVVATPFPASGVEAEPSAATLREVEEAVERAGVPAVFAQVDDSPKVLRQVAADTGVEIVEDLEVEAPASSGSYEEMLWRDARLIAAALTGGQG